MTLISNTIESFRHLLILTLMVVLFLLFLPIIIPLVAFIHWHNDRRMRQLASDMNCQRCGRMMGPNAPKLADRAWYAEADAIKKRLPHRALRVVRKVHAICPYCGMRYGYHEKIGQYVTETQ